MKQVPPGPVQEQYKEVMNGLANGIDDILNGGKKGHDRTVCFVLLLSEFGDIKGGRVNYISNGERDDCISMMKEILARFEGSYIDAPTTDTPQ